MRRTSLTWATLIPALAMAATSCSQGHDTDISILLPQELGLSSLSATSIDRLRATASIPGVLNSAELRVNVDKGTATGSFTLPNENVNAAELTVSFYSAFDTNTDEVLIGRSVTTISIKKGDSNDAKLKEVVTSGEGIFDLNRNERSNLIDLQQGVDPSPGPSPIDVSPATVSFESGIAVGEFTRSFFVLENISEEAVDVDLDIRLAPGVSIVELARLFDNGAASASSHLGITMAGKSEEVFAVTFAPANSLFLVGSLAVKVENTRSMVRHSQLVRLLGNPEGAIPQPPPGYEIPRPEAGTLVGNYSGLVEGYPVENLFSRAPTLSAVPEADLGSIAGIDIDYAYIVAVLPRHRFAVTTDGFADDVDLYLFELDEAFQPMGGPITASKTPGLGPESAEYDATDKRDDVTLLLIAFDNVSGEFTKDNAGGLTQSLDSQDSGTTNTAMYSVPEFLQPCAEDAAPGDLCGPLEAPCPDSYGSALACGDTRGLSQVTIRGRNFLPGMVVQIGPGVADNDGIAICSNVLYQEGFDQINCLVPRVAHLDTSKSTNVTVALTNPDGQAATKAEAFSYLPSPPTVLALTPSSGPTTGGLSVTLRGDDFFSREGVSPQVTVGGQPATDVSLNDDGGLSFVLPACISTDGTQCTVDTVADVEVINPDGQVGALLNGFEFLEPQGPPPAITSIAPSEGPQSGGTVITISGTNFDSNAYVRIGGANASGVSVDVSGSTITARTPAGLSGFANLEVVNGDLQTARLDTAFTYLVPSPAPLFIVPNRGPLAGLNSAVLTGSDFQIGALVFVDDVVASDIVISENGNSAVITIPASTGTSDSTVSVRIRNPDGKEASLNAAYSYEAPTGPPPSISTATPSLGSVSGGESVTLNGANFVVGAQVFFSQTSAQAVAVINGGTQISVVTPPHSAGVTDIMVRNPDGQTGSLAAAYTYEVPAPSFVRVNPAQGSAAGGTDVTVYGKDIQGGAQISFGGLPAYNVTVIGHTQLLCTTPPAASPGSVSVVITNPDGQSVEAAAAFEYAVIPPPSIFFIDPDSGSENGGTTINIIGSDIQEGAFVSIGGASCINPVISGSTSISCTTPAGSGAADVILFNADGKSTTLAGGFTFVTIPAPTVALADPNQGLEVGEQSIQIVGSDFQMGALASLDGSPCSETTFINSGTLACVTPPHAPGSVSITVRNPDGREHTLAAAFTFNALPDPVVLGVSPANGLESGGDQVTITGANFRPTPTVTFGAQAAVGVAFINSTAITVYVPAGSGTADVTVTNPGGKSGTKTAAYIYNPILPPSIGLLNPADGPESGGIIIQIVGSSFRDGALVTFGGQAAFGVQVINASTITCRTPPGTGSVDVTVTNSDATSNTLAGGFAYVPTPPPVIVAVTPNKGVEAGGNQITLDGSGFSSSATVSLDGAACLNTVIIGTNQIHCQAPPHAPGAVEVVVSNPDGQKSTVASGYNYLATPPPLVVSVTPGEGSEHGNTPVQVIGTNFDANATVTFDGMPVTSTVWLSATSISCRTPAHAPGPVSVRVLNSDGQEHTLASAFSYLDETQVAAPPSISVLSPNNGPEAGGNQVEILGSNFAEGLTVSFGTTSAAVWSIEPNRVVVFAPAGTSGAQVVVQLENPDGQSSFGSYDYTTAPPALGILLVLPSDGPAYEQTSVVLLGQSFEQGATVDIEVKDAVNGDWLAPATGVVRLNSETVTALIPAYAGFSIAHDINADIIVTNPDGETSRFLNGFGYIGVSECLPSEPDPCGYGTAANVAGETGGVNETSGNQVDCVCSGTQCSCESVCAGQTDGTACGCGGACMAEHCEMFNQTCAPLAQICAPNPGDRLNGTCVDPCGGCNTAAGEVCAGTASGWQCLQECDGDGVRQFPEQCDGGDLGGFTCLHLDYDGGYLRCDGQCKYDVTGCQSNAGPDCGNGMVDMDEQCDPADSPPDFSCSMIGTAAEISGMVSQCRADCKYDLSDCSFVGQSPYAGCGDGILGGMFGSMGEQCDGPSLGDSATCPDGTGQASCTNDCRLDFALCASSPCGNGRIDEVSGDQGSAGGTPGAYYEECDGTANVVRNCQALGYASGAIGCTATCQFELSACTVPADTCFNGTMDGSETDTDCGGAQCGPCSDSLNCTVGSDCLSSSCPMGICEPATCTDGILNGDEGSVDCGRDCPTGCLEGQSCGRDEDCDMSGGLFCDQSACAVAVCGDGSAGGTEQCDGSDMRFDSCMNHGYETGTLACTAEGAGPPGCFLEFSNCFSGQGAAECSGDYECGGSDRCWGGRCETGPCDQPGWPACTSTCGAGTYDDPGMGCTQCSGIDYDDDIDPSTPCIPCPAPLASSIDGQSCVSGDSASQAFTWGDATMDSLPALGGRTMDIAVGSDGNVYALGTYSSTIDVDAMGYAGAGMQGVLVALDPSGMTRWVVHIYASGTGDHVPQRVAVNPGSGDVCVVSNGWGGNAFIDGTAVGVPIDMGMQNGSSVGSVICIDSMTGTIRWHHLLNTNTTHSRLGGLTFDTIGNVVVVGTFMTSLDVGPFNLSGGAEGDAFISVLSSVDGTANSASRFSSGPGAEYPEAVATFAGGEFAVGGFFTGGDMVLTDPGFPLTETLVPMGANDGFFARIRQDGTVVHAVGISDINNVVIHDVRVGPMTGDYFISGQYDNSVDVGGTTFNTSGTGSIVARINEMDGGVVWASGYANGGDTLQGIYRIKLDGGGSVWAVGTMSGAGNLGGTAIPASNTGSYVITLDGGTGSVNDVVSVESTGAGALTLNAIGLNPMGGAAAVGAFQGDMTIGSTTLTHTGSAGWNQVVLYLGAYAAP